MDYEKYNTVEAVEAYVNTLPHAVKTLLDVPWRAGRRLDTEKVQIILDSLKRPPSNIELNPPSPSNPSATVVPSRVACSASQVAAPSPDEGHILIPFSEVKKWIASTMTCRECRGSIKASYISKTTIGIATQLHLICGSTSCLRRQRFSMPAETVEIAAEEPHAQHYNHRPQLGIEKYAANWRLLAATQLFGESQTAGEIIAGFLDLAPAAFKNNWSGMEEKLGAEHELVSSKLIRQNLEESVTNKLSEKTGGKIPLTVGFDMGWQGGKAFNSLSGHAFLVDVNQGKVIAKKHYSKMCAKCSTYEKKGLGEADVPAHNCSKNYDGSSKGMEASAALAMVLEVYEQVFENGPGTEKAFISQMVLDDDASTRAILSHSLSELANWPVDANGKKLPKSKDIGKLPLDHPFLVFLADLTHRIRCFGKYIFALANSTVSTSTCTLVDAYRLKRNFAYWLLSSHTESFATFKAKSQAVVEHHFNNHDHCGEWCSMKKATAANTASGHLKYRCKEEHPVLYKQIGDVMSRFVTDEKLRECHHGHSSQKNESLNNHIKRYAPKDKTYCQTTSLASRICLAVGIDSVGHEQYYKLLFSNMGINLPVTTRKMLCKMLKKREHNQIYQALPKRKRKRSEMKFRKMRTGLMKQMADKAVGLTYETGQNLGPNSDEEVKGDPCKQKKKTAVVCKYCMGSTHKTNRSKNCKYFGWSNVVLEAEMVRINISRATEAAVGTATAATGSEVQSEGTKYNFSVEYDTNNIQFHPYSTTVHFLHRGIGNRRRIRRGKQRRSHIRRR
jgi:hypothetical protein